MTAAAPSRVVTFLFTDVEGSTRRWENEATRAMRGVEQLRKPPITRGALRHPSVWR